jgi:hypothetical protein
MARNVHVPYGLAEMIIEETALRLGAGVTARMVCQTGEG